MDGWIDKKRCNVVLYKFTDKTSNECTFLLRFSMEKSDNEAIHFSDYLGSNSNIMIVLYLIGSFML